MNINTTSVSLMLQILMLVNISISQEVTGNYNIEKFLDCLPRLSINAPNFITKVIYTPQNASFSSVLNANVRNLRYNTSTTRKPLAIITALEVSHVQATVVCAKSYGLELRIRSGGHDYDGLSYVSPNPFVILDLFNLRSIEIDLANHTAWVQSGATLGELYYNIAKISNTTAFPAGVCPSVGVGGHFSGAGYGNMLRKFGLTVDHIVDAVVIDVNGAVFNRTAMGEDLFWAIRGGDAASFCVVLAWKIRLVQVPEKVTTFTAVKYLDDGGSDVFNQWQHVAHNLDPNLFIRVEVGVVEKGNNKTVRFWFNALYLGQCNALDQLLNQQFPLLGFKKDQCVEQKWIESTLIFYGFPSNSPLEVLLDRLPAYGLSYDKHKSDYIRHTIPKVGLEKLWKKLIEVVNVTMQFNPYGGKMSEISESATPFPHRKGVICKIQYLSVWAKNSIEVNEMRLKEMTMIHSFMTPYVSNNPREAYFNYRDIDIGTNANKSLTFALSYFKGNLNKLLKVKAKVDPSNFFKNEQSIPVLD